MAPDIAASIGTISSVSPGYRPKPLAFNTNRMTKASAKRHTSCVSVFLANNDRHARATAKPWNCQKRPKIPRCTQLAPPTCLLPVSNTITRCMQASKETYISFNAYMLCKPTHKHMHA